MAKKPTEMDPLFAQVFDWQPSRTQKRQIEILESAVEVLASEGIENTSLALIGKRIKMERSHIVYYFKTKEELIRKAIEYISANAQRFTVSGLQSVSRPEEIFSKYFEVSAAWALQYPSHARVMALFYYLCGHRKDYVPLHKHIREVGMERVTQLVRALGVKEEYTQSTAHHIQNVITGTILYAFTTGEESKLSRLMQEVRENCEVLLSARRR